MSTRSYYQPSRAAENTVNPIRQIVDRIKVPQSPAEKPLIPLSIGDPTIFGNMKVPEKLTEAVRIAASSNKSDGYAPSTGIPAVRQVLASRYSYPNTRYYPHTADLPETKISAQDIIICSGCSGALTIAIEALLNPGENFLIPSPGFSLYATIAGRNSIEIRSYNLLPEKSWEIDFTHMRSLIDEKTRAILINNPSNPNGSVFSLSHMKELIQLAEEFHLPIISDEVYADMIFPGIYTSEKTPIPLKKQEFYPLAALECSVPIFTVGGIAKQFVCPGWRLGWLIIYDKGNQIDGLRNGIQSLSQVIIGANTLIQSALVDFLPTVEPSYYIELMTRLESQALFLCEEINEIPGLKAVTPAGAMYLMISIDFSCFPGFSSDSQFSQALLNEEFLFVLPGECFQAPNFIRMVVVAPLEILRDAVKRLKAFCSRHGKK